MHCIISIEFLRSHSFMRHIRWNVNDVKVISPTRLFLHDSPTHHVHSMVFILCIEQHPCESTNMVHETSEQFITNLMAKRFDPSDSLESHYHGFCADKSRCKTEFTWVAICCVGRSIRCVHVLKRAFHELQSLLRVSRADTILLHVQQSNENTGSRQRTMHCRRG